MTLLLSLQGLLDSVMNVLPTPAPTDPVTQTVTSVVTTIPTTVAPAVEPSSSASPYWAPIATILAALIGVSGVGVAIYFQRKSAKETNLIAEQAQLITRQAMTTEQLRWAAKRAISKDPSPLSVNMG